MKKPILFLFCILLLCTFSCENDDNVVPEETAEEEQPITPINFEENFGSSVTARFLGRVVDEQNDPISGVTIRIGNTVTTTDLFGTFSISSSEVFEKFAYIRAEKSGYITGSRALAPSATDVNRVEIMLLEEEVIATITSGETAMVNLSNGTEVSFNGNYTREDGTPYNGQVDVVLKHLSPDDENMEAMMPGMLFAQDASGDAVALETYGMIAVELKSASGEKLQLQEGNMSQISMPIPANSTNPPATIPLWHFDEELGYWVEEGEATLQGNMYVGEVGHFSFWNYDYPYPSITLCITLVDEGGRPLGYTPLDLYSSLLNSTGTYGYTNSVGTECGLVPAGEELTVIVPGSSCQGDPFTTTVGPFTTDTDITITVTANQNVSTFTGTFVNCDGDDVTDGYIQLFIDGTSEIIPVTDGTINYTYSYCGTLDYSLKGVDITSNQITEIMTGTLDGTDIDLGALSSCTGFIDTDEDGVFDTFEDVNGDNDLSNDDTDDDGIPNYQDADDDGDGINTADEDYDGDNDPTNDDSDGDQIPDYLDAQDVVVFTTEALGTECDPVLFDLDAIIDSEGNDLHTYAFYRTEADAQAQSSPLSSPFGVSIADLTSNTQSIYVVATNNTSNQTAIGQVFLYWSYEDSDGDGLTDCEELTGVDNPSTDLIPNGISNPNDPNDPNPQPVATLSISGVTVSEDAGSATIPVSLDVPSDIDTVISISTFDASATQPMDYTATVQTLTIPAGQLSVSFTVPIVDDADVEQTEEFVVSADISSGNVLNPPGVTLSAAVIITDNDTGVNFTIQGADVFENDGVVSIPVMLDNPSNVDTVISISTQDITASSPMDYTAEVQTMTIPAGQVSASFNIQIIDDNISENEETFLVFGVAASTNTFNQQAESVVTIIDDDETPTIPNSGNLSVCDDNGSNVGSFDLNSMDAYYLNGGDGIVSYHTTVSDADNNTNAIPSPYSTSANGVTSLFVRVEFPTGGYDISTLELEVFNSPAFIPNSGPFITACDSSAGTTTDGLGVFDLTQIEPSVFIDNTSNLEVTYYETQADADAGTNPIVSPTTYTSITPTVQTIYARATNIQNGCVTIFNFEINIQSDC
ncbi:Calx-beta domain-containing protein [Kordia algicida OT-1]|uniref:Calx-beta domain-containing protein n=1 Tax=Kordia algicida OT-1 TaxID=391587 RepID=A9E3G2_9FLAO|nr:Calx-beta domain-containing protein [Kordia algicida]EDP95506.1 hypothetical protein KAOT1_11301 [Kordia algicida OT-1]